MDNGIKGDRFECVECAEGYDFRIGNKCVQECPIGYYQDGINCYSCDSSCRSCSGTPDNCTSCKSQGSLPFLLGNKCIPECPSGMGNRDNVCFDCEFPCAECSSGPLVCTECSQDQGLLFLLGPTCTNECPVGYIVNEIEKKCEGCAGCDVCDKDDQRICLECSPGLLMLNDECVSDCPKGYLSNYSASECYPISGLDIDLIPFPCLILAIVFFFLSYVGSKQKRKHLLIPNWLVLMGFLEHGILLSQIILTAQFGTWHYMIFVVIAWLCFVASNVAFLILHFKKVSMKDRMYNNWRNRPQHIWARRLMNVFGVLGSWKSYKLSYAAFWGFKLTPAKFTHPGVFRKLQKIFLWVNIFSVYAVIICCNCYGLYDLSWGTQLYIQMLENIIIFVLVAWAAIWEQSKQESDYLADQKFAGSKGSTKLNVMSALDD